MRHGCLRHIALRRCCRGGRSRRSPALALVICRLRPFRRARGLVWRAPPSAVLLVILVNPSLVEEKREPQHDVAVVVVDESASQRIGERTQHTEAALANSSERLGRLKDLDVRVVHAGKPDDNATLADTGTQLFTALDHAIADVPRQRLAGVDHDHRRRGPRRAGARPPRPRRAAPRAAVRPAERESTAASSSKQAPSFGLVGKERAAHGARSRICLARQPGARARLTMRKDGGAASQSRSPSAAT